MSRSLLSKQHIIALSYLYMRTETVSLVRRFSKEHSVLVGMRRIELEDAMSVVHEKFTTIKDLYDSGLDPHIKNIIRKSIVKCHF